MVYKSNKKREKMDNRSQLKNVIYVGNMRHFLYSMLSNSVIWAFPSPTGGDSMVSKDEHAQLSKNVQEMKKNLSSLEESSVSDSRLE